MQAPRPSNLERGVSHGAHVYESIVRYFDAPVTSTFLP